MGTKGVPVRIEIGPRDVESSTVVLARRDNKVKSSLSRDEITEALYDVLNQIQNNLFNQAKSFRDSNTFKVKHIMSLKI